MAFPALLPQIPEDSPKERKLKPNEFYAHDWEDYQFHAREWAKYLREESLRKTYAAFKKSAEKKARAKEMARAILDKPETPRMLLQITREITKMNVNTGLHSTWETDAIFVTCDEPFPLTLLGGKRCLLRIDLSTIAIAITVLPYEVDGSVGWRIESTVTIGDTIDKMGIPVLNTTDEQEHVLSTVMSDILKPVDIILRVAIQ